MKYSMNWLCCIKGENDLFPANVPGNVQQDYAAANGWGDHNYGDNCKEYICLEDKYWIYKTNFKKPDDKDKKTFFVSYGIDYECDIYINNKHLMHHIGMFEKIEIDLSSYLMENNTIEIVIYPPPKDENCKTVDRSQAAQSTKAAVSYGWDWHPRLIPTGIWQETYLETRGSQHVGNVEVNYNLNENLTEADVEFFVDCAGKTIVSLFDPCGNLIYEGSDKVVHVDSVKLWWCNGQGNPDLYKYEIKSAENTVVGYVGFKKVELQMNEGAWEEPSLFPKTRSVPPITITLNNRRIFAKGSNFLPPEIFYGSIDFKRYESLVKLAKDANMNILRSWGGAIIHKKWFYELCDKYGIMVWQEFPLACNDYYSTEEYLNVLEQEAKSIITTLRSHACLVLWCGGNELFNRWSGMTEQSLALRLLNKLCYEYDRNTPFIMTAPLMGMGHGHYMYHDKNINQTVFEMQSNAHCTAYSEFGLPSISDYDRLREIIPDDDFENISPGTTWETHHGFNSWDAGSEDTWLCFDNIDVFFDKQKNIQDYINCSNILQGEGLKFIYEEARRQKPYCSMALNWCYNEVWKVAAGHSIISYPDVPKPSYYCVKEALRNVLPSLKSTKFRYRSGEEFTGELWLLNDSNKEISATVDVYLMYNDKKKHILTWKTDVAKENTNLKGHTICFDLPDDYEGLFEILLTSEHGDSIYKYVVFKSNDTVYSKGLNA